MVHFPLLCYFTGVYVSSQGWKSEWKMTFFECDDYLLFGNVIDILADKWCRNKMPAGKPDHNISSTSNTLKQTEIA